MHAHEIKLYKEKFQTQYNDKKVPPTPDQKVKHKIKLKEIITFLQKEFGKLEIVPYIVDSTQIKQTPHPFSEYLHEHNEVLKHLHPTLPKNIQIEVTQEEIDLIRSNEKTHQPSLSLATEYDVM